MHRNNSWLSEAGYTKEQERELFDKQLDDVIDNTRWYLDNLDYMVEYKVYWTCYTRRSKKGQNFITFPKGL